jgi:hypothetical protein
MLHNLQHISLPLFSPVLFRLDHLWADHGNAINDCDAIKKIFPAATPGRIVLLNPIRLLNGLNGDFTLYVDAHVSLLPE